MKRSFFFSACLISQLGSAAYDLAPLVPPEVEKSSSTALTMDQWVAKQKAEHPALTAEPAEPTEPRAVASAPPSHHSELTPATEVPKKTRIAMNEMPGTVTSIDQGEQSLRITVEGGYNPQFNYDEKTTVEAGERSLKVKDLKKGDNVVVRYIGKDLTARDIEVLNQPK